MAYAPNLAAQISCWNSRLPAKSSWANVEGRDIRRDIPHELRRLNPLVMLLMLPFMAAAEEPQHHTVDCSGVKISYIVAGKGEPVVLIHGYCRALELTGSLLASSETSPKTIR